MRNKKTWLIAACAALIITASVFGTMAYLVDSTEKVENTFVVGKLLEDSTDFVLLEHQAEMATSGVYTLGATEVAKNAYTVLPGVDIPKDPFVKTTEALKLDAYVFVEVVEDKWGAALSYTVDRANWTELSGVTGPKRGKVYAMNGKAEAGEKLGPVYILKDDEITVTNAEFTTDEQAAALYGGKLDFYGYMTQAAGFADAAAAWAGAFGTPAVLE